jgi:release factor glutamine methyltransferase
MTEAARTAGRRAGGPAGGDALAASVATLLADGERVLVAAGVGDARREALTLLGAIAETSPGALWAGRAEPVAPDTAAAFLRAVAQRAAGVPAAYAAETAAFRTLELHVDRRVLIPRPETEGLVDHVLDWCRTRGRWGVAVDIGTGSGCIALSLAAEGRFARVVATDVSDGALAVARRNAAGLRVAGAVEFRAGDLLWALGPGVADVIVSNPPYVSAAEWAALDAGVRDHEPRVALVGGGDGLAHTAVLLGQARGRLAPHGLLALEVDCRRADRTLALARAEGWTSARIERDLFGRERYLLAEREAE